MPGCGSPTSEAGRMDDLSDDLGTAIELPRPPRRVVSLVPSLTEALAATGRELLVGATEYCTHPADLDVPRVAGSRFPDLGAVRALRPDLVLANAEENRPGHGCPAGRAVPVRPRRRPRGLRRAGCRAGLRPAPVLVRPLPGGGAGRAGAAAGRGGVRRPLRGGSGWAWRGGRRRWVGG